VQTASPPPSVAVAPPPAKTGKIKEQPQPGVSYPQDTTKTFEDISRNGDTLFAPGPDDMIKDVGKILDEHKGESIDLVVCLDTTASMRKHVDAVKAQLPGMLQGIISNYPSFRVGMVLYKDYYDEYLNKIIGFTSDMNVLKKSIAGITAGGGLDIPEAVYEALSAGATGFDWKAPTRLMILIGDAPPHPVPQGMVTKNMVDEAVQKESITVSAIILSDSR
jgi:Mg-chelatase subunit ChlD